MALDSTVVEDSRESDVYLDVLTKKCYNPIVAHVYSAVAWLPRQLYFFSTCYRKRESGAQLRIISGDDAPQIG